jgi:hypothetical protein
VNKDNIISKYLASVERKADVPADLPPTIEQGPSVQNVQEDHSQVPFQIDVMKRGSGEDGLITFKDVATKYSPGESFTLSAVTNHSGVWQFGKVYDDGTILLARYDRDTQLMRVPLDTQLRDWWNYLKDQGLERSSSSLASVERTAGGPAKDLSYAAISLENLSERISSDVLSKVYESLGDVKDLRSEGALDHLDLSDYDRLVSRVTKESAAIGLSIALLSKATDRLSEGY